MSEPEDKGKEARRVAAIIIAILGFGITYVQLMALFSNHSSDPTGTGFIVTIFCAMLAAVVATSLAITIVPKWSDKSQIQFIIAFIPFILTVIDSNYDFFAQTLSWVNSFEAVGTALGGGIVWNAAKWVRGHRD